MRVAAICVLVCACGFWGMRRAGRLSGRIEQLLMAMEALRRLQGYMLHWKRELCDALISAGTARGLGAVLKTAGGRMQEEYDALPGAVLSNTLEKAQKEELRELHAKDWNVLYEFFSSLHMLDSEQAGARFGFVMERLCDSLAEARAEKEKKSRLIRSLGWMTGLAIALLLA